MHLHAPRRLSGLSAAFVLTAALLGLSGCITPPAVLSGGHDHIPFEELPPGSVAAAEDLGDCDESVLRGVFVPSDPGAPIVLHLLESGGSATDGARAIGAYPHLERLADMGFASLVLDYRGVGLSDGERSPHHLRADARAAWNAAVRLAGGEHRVVLRGTSIGTIAAASLLEDGARPAAVVLVAPVRAETVAGHFAVHSYGSLLGGAIALFLRDAGDADLVEAVRTCPSPLLVLTADEDSFLPSDERELVAAAVSEAGGTYAAIADETHLGLVLRANQLDPIEKGFLRSIFPDLPAVAARMSRLPRNATGTERVRQFVSRRLADPALAISSGRPGFPRDPWSEELLVRWWRDVTWARATPYSDEHAQALLDFADPSGVALDPREFPALRRFAERARESGADAGAPFVEELIAVARERELGSRAFYERAPADGVFDPLLQMIEGLQEAHVGAPEFPDDAPARLRLAEGESLRLAVRHLLKAAGIPERVRGDASTGLRVEADWGDGWTALDLEANRNSP